MILSFVTSLLVGILVGLISSMLGLGGGILIVPLLTIVFHLPHNQAIATSLMTIAFITALNTFRFWQKKMINFRMVLTIVVFSAFSSMLGGYLATALDERLLLAIFILFVLYVLAQTLFLQTRETDSRKRAPSYWFWGATIGISSGLISGTTGVGGGAIITPLLFKSRVEKQERVVPITNAVMLINAVFALIPLAWDTAEKSSWLMVGLIHVDLALLVFLGAIPASLWGTHFQDKLPLKVKKILISLILLVILIRMGLKFFTGN